MPPALFLGLLLVHEFHANFSFVFYFLFFYFCKDYIGIIVRID